MTNTNITKFANLIFSMRRLIEDEKPTGMDILERTEEQKAYSSMIYELEQKLSASMDKHQRERLGFVQAWYDTHIRGE